MYVQYETEPILCPPQRLVEIEPVECSIYNVNTMRKPNLFKNIFCEYLNNSWMFG